MQNGVQLLMFMVMWSIQEVCAFQWVWKGGINNPGEGKGDGSGETGGDGEGEMGGDQKHKSRHLYHAITPLWTALCLLFIDQCN